MEVRELSQLEIDQHERIQRLLDKWRFGAKLADETYKVEIVRIPTPEEPRKITSATRLESTEHVSLLRSIFKMSRRNWDNFWMQTIGLDNLALLHESSIEKTLVRVKTTAKSTACDLENSNSIKKISFRKYFSFEFDFEKPKSQNIMHIERKAIFDFLILQLKLDSNKKFAVQVETMTKCPREIYINTRFFNDLQWEWLSKLLYICRRDTLENLWLDQVDFEKYSKGINWMKTLQDNQNNNDNNNQSCLWLTKLKFYTIFWQGSDKFLDSQTLHSLLIFVKPINLPLHDFWSSSSECQVQIWNTGESSDLLHVLMDPVKSTLYLEDLERKLKEEIDLFLEIEESAASLILKVFYVDPPLHFFQHVMNPQLLTHLGLTFSDDSVDTFFFPVDSPHMAIDALIYDLGQFSSLITLALSARVRFIIDLESLNILDNLSFLFLDHARVLSGSVELDNFPWKPSVQTVILIDCKCQSQPPEKALEKSQAIELQQDQNGETGETQESGQKQEVIWINQENDLEQDQNIGAEEPGASLARSVRNAYILHLLPQFFK